MAINYFNRYIWLIDVINRHGHISRKNISELWARSTLNEVGESYLPERTFHNHIEAIYNTFGIEVKCDRSLGYYISNNEDIEGGGIKKWLLQSLSLNNLLNESTNMRNSIIFEEVPSSEKYLIPIIEAIRDRKAIEITYQGFHKDYAATFEVEPYCLKQFKQRWYMVGKSAASDKPWIYGLDRIKKLYRTDRSYKIPKKFTAEGYFKDLFGICTDDNKSAESIEIKVDNPQFHYFNSLKLHESQTPIEEKPDYTIFRYHLVPTYDFTQELLSKSDSIEVLKPQWYRDEIKNTLKKMLNRYKD